MRQTEVKVGGEYRAKVGNRLAPVTVKGTRERRVGVNRWQTVYDCTTGDTGRDIVCTAARLRPLPGTPEAAAEQARARKAAAKRAKARPAAAPVPAYEPKLVAPAPVPGMVERVNPAKLVEPLVGLNREMVERVVAGVHVAMPWSAACREVYRVINRHGDLHKYPKPLRRAAWLAVAEEHARNRKLYRETMGHAPTPSEEIVAAALAGDAQARAAVLAQ